jgi:hypothetical protein
MYWCNRGENYQEREKRKKGIAQAKKGFFFSIFPRKIQERANKIIFNKREKGRG